ncbi:CNNM domain-containing protein, partial [Micromonospora saelicesensis]|uniref:CNNM domain-containing protein n=1 Tax=Micromonospora saelicesensis TaxID=285676 RepID=UPI0021AC8281
MTTLLPLVGFVALTAGNAFFVAAEFALVTVDRAEIDRRAAARDQAALTVRNAPRGHSLQPLRAHSCRTTHQPPAGYVAHPALARPLSPQP